jgi:hypothetical protein
MYPMLAAWIAACLWTGIPSVASANAAPPLGPAEATSEPVFVDVTSGPLGGAGNGQGVAWGDYDNDGDLDLYLANSGTANKLFRNDGGTWVDATSGPLGNTGDGRSAVWGDYDNDGDLDLYLSNVYSGNKLFRNEGGGAFVNATSGPLGDTGNDNGVAWGDYDNDGDLDLYLANWDGANKLFRNEGPPSWSFVDATSAPLGDTGHGIGVAWGDYDNDGDLDLYLANDRYSGNKLFRNEGGGAFADATSGPLGDTGEDTGVAWGDYDNDGDLDLYLAKIGQANKLFRNEGPPSWSFVDATSAPLGDTGGGFGVAWGDYDNDGDLDLYLANYGQANKLFRNDGGAWVDATSGPLGDTGVGTGVAWGDYDNDGDLDLYLANAAGNKLFRNDGQTGRHWLQVKLQGVVSNRSGIGARVRVVAGGVSRIEEISGGSGYCSQNSLVAEFGLGAATVVDSLIVRWPCGIVWDTAGVAVDQQLRISEGSGRVAVDEVLPLPRTLELSAAAPNPFHRSTRIDYALPSAGRVRLTVHDLQGRRVATLAEGDAPAGRYSVIWDGRIAGGGSAHAGVYFVRLAVSGAAGGEERLRKIVVTR